MRKSEESEVSLMSGTRVDHGFGLIVTHKQCFVITALMQVLNQKSHHLSRAVQT